MKNKQRTKGDPILFKSNKHNEYQFLSNFWPNTGKPDEVDQTLVQEVLRIPLKLRGKWYVMENSETAYQMAKFEVLCSISKERGEDTSELYHIYAISVIAVSETALQAKKLASQASYCDWAFKKLNRKLGMKKRLIEIHQEVSKSYFAQNYHSFLMKRALKKKFNRKKNPFHHSALVATRGSVLKEQRGRMKSIWDCSADDGVGVLGHCLAEVRDEIE
jgi:hypothetical protein